MQWHSTRVMLMLMLAGGLALSGAGCDRRVYVVNGVTDGARFYILPQQLEDENPVSQSWVAYSLARSTCQIRRGSDTPSRDTAFECELAAREALLRSWRAYRAAGAPPDEYLDTLTDVSDAGFLAEYVWHYLHEEQWQRPDELGLKSFAAWRELVLDGHEPQTRLIGNWI